MGKGKRLKGIKKQSVISKEQERLSPEIQRITQEVLQDVLENLKDYEGLSEGQIHQKVVIRVRERCKEELGMDIGF